jgi:hypothetical protein
MPLEVLDRALVLLRRFERSERPQIPALSRLRVFLARLQPVFAGGQLANHTGGLCKRKARLPRRFEVVLLFFNRVVIAQCHRVAEDLRMRALHLVIATLCLLVLPNPVFAEESGQHDFDFEIGVWKTHVRRRLRPLTGSDAWTEVNGTTTVTKVWNGRGNLVELVADGPSGPFEGVSLRLYDPQARQWRLHFANSRDGKLDPPTIGQFKNGRGEFYSQDTFGGRAILVRFVISDITPTSCRFEQAFSDDGGKTWEVNWIATDTRVAIAPE